MILLLYLVHGIFSSGLAHSFFSKSVFGRGLKLPSSRTAERKWSASVVARVLTLVLFCQRREDMLTVLSLGGRRFFRPVHRGKESWFESEVVPGDTGEVGRWCLKKVNSPWMTPWSYHMFGHLLLGAGAREQLPKAFSRESSEHLAQLALRKYMYRSPHTWRPRDTGVRGNAHRP